MRTDKSDSVLYSQSYHKDHIEEGKYSDRLLIFRLLKYLLPYRYWLALAIVLMVIVKAIEALVPIWIGKIAQQVLNSYASPEESLIAYHEVIAGSLIVIIWIIFGYFLEGINVYLKSFVGQKALLTLRIEVFRHIQDLPIPFYDRCAVGRLMTRTIHDVDQISQMFSEGVVPILGNALLFLGILIGILVIDWKVGLAVCVVLPFVWYLTHYFRVNQRRCYEMIRAIVSSINAFAQENLMGMSTVKHFGLQKQERKKFDALNEDHRKANMETVHYFSFFIAGIDLLQSIALIIVFAMIVYLAVPSEGFQSGVYFTFSLYVLMFFRPLGDLAERYNVLQSAMAAATRIFDILDVPQEPKGLTEASIGDEIHEIVFNNVWFAYEGENWILKGISFVVKKGESVAFVGMTGAGKTTIINLLLRFYEYQRGSICINGKEIRDYSIDSVRRLFSVITQDPVIFFGTVKDNITLYDPTLTQEKIESAIDYVNLRPVIDRFSDKIDHVLKERGISLSLGEMQLIAFARAVAHQRSAMILDEATANIDSRSEKMIQEALEKMMRGKTALMIAHRLSTIRDVDRIIVLNQGRVAESGTHGELMLLHGIYEKLYLSKNLS